MGSLQEQLLQSGLVNEKQLEKAKHKKKPSKNRRKSKSAQKAGNKKVTEYKKSGKKTTQSPTPEPTEVVLGKALRVEIKKLLRANKLNDKEGEIPYNYVVNNQVKRFYLNAKQQKSLTAGELGIVNWNNRSYLIPVTITDELKKLHDKIEIYLVDKDEAKADKSDDDYAGFEIPDDLTW